MNLGLIENINITRTENLFSKFLVNGIWETWLEWEADNIKQLLQGTQKISDTKVEKHWLGP